jgi:hypothetical protein
MRIKKGTARRLGLRKPIDPPIVLFMDEHCGPLDYWQRHLLRTMAEQFDRTRIHPHGLSPFVRITL